MIASRFKFQPILMAATLIGLAILIGLGSWQLQRRAWKLDLIEKVDARINAAPVSVDEILQLRASGQDVEYANVTVTGQYLNDSEAHVFGTFDGKPGYYIFTPFQLAPNGPSHADNHFDIVYVNRGFAPQSVKAVETRKDGLVTELVTLTAVFREYTPAPGIASLFTPQNQPTDNIWYERSPAAFAQIANLNNEQTAMTWYLEDKAKASGTYPQPGTTRIDFNNRHLEYALTWYGLALTLVGVFIAFSYKYNPSKD